ncbi:MAG TPA: SAM-dependent methyltransferase [Streptosporangiaceae bacterium]|nr:SAM-dependent methyltransferase [Streptosporangiaceae bacterium]
MNAEQRGRSNSGVPVACSLERRHLPVAVSRVAEHESWRKELHRPATYVHKWWARRLGSVLRSVLVAAASTGGKQSARALDGAVVYDPFGGAGTTLVEAVKLGARVVARDINPVATLTQRQALQAWDFETVERLFAVIEASCRADIDALYVTAAGEPVLHYFWVAIADCPDCGEHVELFSTYVFAKHAYPSRHPKGQATCPHCHAVCPMDVTADTEGRCSRCRTVFGLAGPVRGRTMTCLAGHQNHITAALARQKPRRRMYAKMVRTADDSREYREIDEFDLDLYDRASKLLAGATVGDVVTPEGDLTDGTNTIQALRWGYRTWASFFNDRQLYCLGRIASALRDLPGRSPEREALVAAFGKTVEHHNGFCSFKGEGTGPVRSIFHNHVLRPERCSVEGNPWGAHGGSGGYADTLARLRRAHEYKLDPTDLIERAGTVIAERGLSAPVGQMVVSCWDDFVAKPDSAYVVTGDGGRTDIPNGAVTLVVTDPPYVDNVHYSELADFFHAWLRGIDPYPGYPTGLTTRDQREVQNTGAEEFRTMAADVWRECARVLSDDGLLAFSFHQSQTPGWEAVMRSLADAGFVVTAVRPVVAEVTTSLTKAAALAPNRIDVIVVCRKVGIQPARATPAQARARVMTALLKLRDSGLALGDGDALSAARASVLALGTHDPDCDWQELRRAAEAQAVQAAAELGSHLKKESFFR